MGNTLRDQLLKQGLVSKKQAKQAEQEIKSKTHQAKKNNKKSNKSSSAVTTDTHSVTYLAAKAREEEIARAKALNRQKEVERQKKALEAQIQDIIHFHHINDPDAEGVYYFLDGRLVKKILVTFKQRKQLAQGQLAITVLEENYYLVPLTAAKKIMERLPETVICLHQNPPETLPKDDLYVRYPIPEDLIW